MTSSKIRLLSGAAALALAGAITCIALCAAPPAALDAKIVHATAALTSEQQQQLKTFVEAWIDQLADARDARPMSDARQALTDQLRDMGATPAFRRAFATAAKDKLEPIVAGKDPQKAIMAMEVVRFLGTPEAVDLLQKRIPASAEADQGKRLFAAKALAAALTDADLKQAQFDGATRAIVAAAQSETNALIVIQELSALAAIANRKGSGNVLAAPTTSMDLALKGEADLLEGLVQGVKKAPAADQRMEAVHLAVDILRNQWVTLDPTGWKKLGTELAPVLVEILATARKHWDSAHGGSASLKRSYENAVTASETMLRLIESTQASGGAAPRQTPERQLASAWEKNSQADFDKALDELGRKFPNR